MNKLFFTILLILITNIFAFAQTVDDYSKGEFFAGYSSASVVDDEFVVVGRGFNAAVVYNVKRYFGIKGDVSGVYDKARTTEYTPFFNNPGMTNVSYRERQSIYNFTGGVQVKNNSTNATLKPFAHALVGVGQYRNKVTNMLCSTSANCSLIPANQVSTGFSFIVGGGLDIALSDKIDLRVVQLDVNTISYKRTAFNDTGIATFRFSAGIVFK